MKQPIRCLHTARLNKEWVKKLQVADVVLEKTEEAQKRAENHVNLDNLAKRMELMECQKMTEVAL